MDRPTRGQMKNAEAGDQCKYIHDVGWMSDVYVCACIYIYMYTWFAWTFIGRGEGGRGTAFFLRVEATRCHSKGA